MIYRFAIAAALLAGAATAQQPVPPPAPSPGEIVAQALPSEWMGIDPQDLLVMDLAPDAGGKVRRVVIQLIAPPFSEPWVANIRTLAKAHWWDGLAIVRAQDNYVVQWGDPNGEDKAKAKPLPALVPTRESDYTVAAPPGLGEKGQSRHVNFSGYTEAFDDVYAGWPMATDQEEMAWPVHCYGTVGVGRNMSPDAGTGAELYTVIGHAPRHLDRNIAVVGRVIEGIEHLSTLPRGTEALGFYKTAEERTPIVSIRLGSDVAGLPAYQYLSTEGATFARYADARSNRRDPFFIVPAGGADVCNIPVPVRRAPDPAR
jgi:cyclophilin family peptidyl-prolyl cis-trans isomerase